MNVVEPLARAATGSLCVARCLGSFRLEDRSCNPLHVRTRKARALIAVLALNGRPITRDRLADMLWSDRDEMRARSSLRQTIFELQRLDLLGGPILAPGREDVSLVGEAIVTDLELIRSAAALGDWPRLLTLLETSEGGLLSDLDGLDPELDDWLRHQRAHEPGKSLAAALDAAERCADETGSKAALDLVAEILRIQPENEEATRLAMRFAHDLGDSVAIHRHFTALRDWLRNEYDAEPSEETVVLFRQLANGSAAALIEDRPSEPVAAESAAVARTATVRPAIPPAGPRSRMPAAALALALLASLVALAAFAWDARRADGAAVGPVVLAVLPFDEQPRGDGFLATGLWEHTRAALTRNGAMRVLGPSTSAIMARQELAARDYRRRFGVTHLLEGSVRRTGEQVLVSVSLSQTSDGVAIWQGMFRGRMGEPLALQDRIASGIEGRLRGRLARSGGRRAEQIVTVPEVYALYSEARGLMASWSPANMARAKALLRKAVALDPNYAPAWSTLGAATFFTGRLAIIDEKARAEAILAVRRALELAPNLAQAHASLALVEDKSSEATERSYRRAIALDPGYADAWMWLGDAFYRQRRLSEAMDAYQRAIAIDPLLWPAVQSLASTATEIGDDPALDRLMLDLARAGADPMLVGSVRADRLMLSGDYSGAIRVLEGLGLDPKGRTPPALWFNWFEALSGIGRTEHLHPITGCPDWYAPLLEGKIAPPTVMEGRPVSPQEFWTSFFFSHPASRMLVERGRSSDLVKLYRAAFTDADDFITRTDRHGLLSGLAPTLAVALRHAGQGDEADYLLAAAANEIGPAAQSASNRLAKAELATIRASQGDNRQAIALLTDAIRRGWLPNGRQHALDLAREPAFAGLRGDPRFEAIRGRILAHIARERAELGPLRV